MNSCLEWISVQLRERNVDVPVSVLQKFIPYVTDGENERLELLNWVCFSKSYLNKKESFLYGVQNIQECLSHATYLVGSILTVADLSVYCMLESSSYFQTLLTSTPTESICHVKRYYDHLRSLDPMKKWKEPLERWRQEHSVRDPTPSPDGLSMGKTTASEMRFETGGKFGELTGATMGEVVVRFPPEASGFLHIGHAKAALLNQHYRDTFKGRLILRFDDTNPQKEKSVYEEAILSDLPRLGVRWDHRSHTSDHFELLLNLCEKLIREGKAYVDNTDAETMKIEREARKPSACRDNAIEKNLAWWEEMKQATEFGQQCCVRAKIDMNSNNGALRDPTLYRCKREAHVRTGSKYKVYPTYDFACPVVDSIEGVTHALRTSEYNDRNDQFAWVCQALGLRCPLVTDYSRLALQNTVLSKRKLTWFVDEGLVDGWDDPRMPTVSGILRRGMTAEGLRQFILAQGSSRSSAQMEWDKIWAFNKKVIDPIAPRFTGLLMDPTAAPPQPCMPHGLVPVHVGGQTELCEKQVPVHPKNEHLGQRTILVGPLVYIEYADAVALKVGENVTLINWGNCRVTTIRKSGDHITDVDVKLNLEDTDYKKTLKCTWLAEPGSRAPGLTPVTCLIYDHILTKAIITKDDDFKQFINYNSKTQQCLVGDSCLRDLKRGDIIQLQRRGYYICDSPYDPKSSSTGFESPCVLIQIPEGSTKAEQQNIAGNKSSGSAKSKPSKPTVEMSAEDAAKAVERQRKKDEKKEARKEGRAKYKQQAQASDPSTEKSVGSTSVVDEIPEKGGTKSTTTEPKSNKQKNKKSCIPPLAVEQPSTTPGATKSQAKKQTRLALEARKEEAFADWYSQLITKSELLEYYDISGCYILRPWAYSIWQSVQRFMDDRLQAMGVENAYFPIFVSKASLEREKTHVSDFAPEVAWVTKSGNSDMAEPVAIRPTSETIMYPAFAKWIQSHRDLPIKLNQWSNVVRWEFKHPQPFLRTREFLWQEGHTAYAEKAEAEAEVLAILDLYAEVYEQLLAVPVVKGRKTEKEKFAGADYTTTIEAYISGTGRAIQGATSHHLGQNFSRMFEITYDHPTTGMSAHVFQNSWGLTTRCLGVLFMVHGDNQGLILPPRVAPIQIVIIPCGITNKMTEEDKQQLIQAARDVESLLKQNNACRVRCDDRTNVSPGWKFNHWELKGVPVRLEIGPQEVIERSVCLIFRYNGEKLKVPVNQLCNRLPSLFDSIHIAMLEKAKVELTNHVCQVTTMDQLCTALDSKSLALAPFCGDSDCEEFIRNESARNIVVEPGAPAMGAKSLCIPFACDFNPNLKCGRPNSSTKCFNQPRCQKMATAYTLFGRSY